MRSILLLLLAVGSVSASEPVFVVLSERATCPAAIVTVGHIGKLSGPAAWQKAVAAIDLAELPVRETTTTITRRQVEVRLKLAGLKEEDFRVLGAESVTVVAERAAVPVEDVVRAARAALLTRLPYRADELSVELIKPVTVKMPEVGPAEEVDIKAEPNTNEVRLGRVQMNVTISTRGQKRLVLPVFFDAKLASAAAPPPERVVPAAATRPAPPVPPVAAGPVVVKVGAKVKLAVTVGELRVTTDGVAQQEGRVGQIIRVRSTNSNKLLTGRVVDATTIDME